RCSPCQIEKSIPSNCSNLDETCSSLAIALIWAAHISGDRALGYGLKYESNFKHTHLGKIGR
ncbi:MAG: DUF4260 family protein, partial [Ahrensia sp.]|nr:DUF4260 family protein [Ahrensia sp.]